METTIQLAGKAQSTEIKRIFELQKKKQYAIANQSASERIKKLKRLHKSIVKYRSDIKEALFNDFKKHPSEVDLTEIYPITSEIKHVKSNLRRWMSDERVSTPLSLMGSSSYIHYEPKGVVLIMAPWNFPVNLVFGPLISAIAAGNCVIIKPSEHTPYASAIMKKIITEVFDESEVHLFEGAVDTAQELLSLPFNHIFFTGSPAVGKIVMAAAAKHLSSVTMELGGKSPTIVDQSANIDAAARRIAWAKFVNCGQICIAPDYLFVHESKKQAFIDRMKYYLDQYYTEEASSGSSYARMVNRNHYSRVKEYFEDALDKGANIQYGGKFNTEENYISPTIVSEVPMDSKLMTEEIFGPILPIHAFSDINKVIEHINAGEKPLALYIYSSKRKNIKLIMNNTRAGGSCINHSGVHFYNTNLPFGGSNNSGIGKAGGHFGFKSFSNARGVYKQNFPGALEMLTPPYNSFKQKLIDLTIKYF